MKTIVITRQHSLCSTLDALYKHGKDAIEHALASYNAARGAYNAAKQAEDAAERLLDASGHPLHSNEPEADAYWDARHEADARWAEYSSARDHLLDLDDAGPLTLPGATLISKNRDGFHLEILDPSLWAEAIAEARTLREQAHARREARVMHEFGALEQRARITDKRRRTA